MKAFATNAIAPQGVLWDMDGVLIDSERLVRDAFIDVMANGGPVPDAPQRYLETIGLNRGGLIDWFSQFVNTSESAEYWIDQTYNGFLERAKTELELKPGVIAALDHVRALGLPQLVVTSTRTEAAQMKLSQLGVLDRFEGVLGGDQVSQGKPHPEPYLRGSDWLKLAPGEAVAVEDSANGVRSALAAGCQVLHVPDLIETDPSWHGQLSVLPSLVDFPSWFNSRREHA
ncbi:HAD family hydrolase [Saccharospirillum mangrovi]|uniref:HAD family hydrolase n=1 Tax=Saccharospirillum mangrovi TaxID=2161747 RepID=UPI000D38A5CB|nr:HAD family phosphatase [Saccharospirillum mangrovi]